MSNIFVEVDEAMKQERLEKLWQRYGGFFIGFLAIIILGTAANAGYKSWKTSKNTSQTSVFLNAIDKENYSAQDMADISKNLDGNLRNIVEINAAGLMIEEGRVDKALEIYDNLIKNTKKNNAIRQLASYMNINISKELSAKEKLSKLETIISDKKNPWRYHAQLDAAVLEANMTHNYAKAREHLTAILLSKDTPKSLKQKAQSLNILYATQEKTSGADK